MDINDKYNTQTCTGVFRESVVVGVVIVSENISQIGYAVCVRVVRMSERMSRGCHGVRG